MKSLLVCIPSHEYYQKYINSDSFISLRKNFEVNFMFNNLKVDKSKIRLRKNYFFYNADEKTETKFMGIIHLGMRYHKKKSKSFRYLFRRYYPNFFDFCMKHLQIKNEKKDDSNKFIFCLVMFLRYFNPISKEKPFLKRIRIEILSQPLIFKFFKKYFIDSIPIDKNIDNIVKRTKPKLIIYPSHCYEPESVKLVKIARKNNCKILFLIDNWDNISSKTVLFEKPDALTVWGRQGRKLAVNLQGMKNKNVYHLGNPKFAEYFLLRNKQLKKIYNFPYVVFVGVLQPYNEIAPLKLIDEEIEKNKEIYKNLKVIYRPHPGREFLILNAKKQNFKNIIFDKNMDKYLKTKKRKHLENKNLYFQKLVKNSLFLFGGLTTVILEALILRKKYIFLSHPEKNNLTDPYKMYKGFNHYDEVHKIKYLYECPELEKLKLMFRNLYIKKNYNNINKFLLDKQMSYFYDPKNYNYPKSLYNIVNKII